MGGGDIDAAFADAEVTVEHRFETRAALGESDRARELALASVAIEKNEDPWWDYQVGGVNMPMLHWLRQAAQAS